MEPVHDRMPVILASNQWATWLDPANNDLDTLGALLVGCDDDVLVMHEVSTEVNNVRNKDEHLVDEIDPDAVPPAEDGHLPLG